MTLMQVASGLAFPVCPTAPAGDARLFLVEKGGRIRIIDHGAVLPAPFLDIGDRVSDSGQQGLLRLAFDPVYATTGRFYVDYTDRDGDTRIARFRVSSDPHVAHPNHNPFVGTSGAHGEVWNIGLRNPWRFSFDRRTGDRYIADVGQNAHEEIDASPAAAGGGRGLNYGWNLMEGSSCYGAASCSRQGLTLPVARRPSRTNGRRSSPAGRSRVLVRMQPASCMCCGRADRCSG